MSVGQIHDLGYKRYLGSRRELDTRWRVIMRHQIATAWKGWWRFKPWLIAALIATSVASVVLYLASGKTVRMLTGIAGQQIAFADGILPLSIEWYCKIGFVASLTVSALVVAGDVQSGAFTFYFARSVRPRDYVIGKLAGLVALLSLIMLAGPMLLACLRLGLSDSTEHLIDLLPTIGKALAVGALGTLTYAAVPLGFSAVVPNWRYATALWAAYYMIFGTMMQLVATLTAPAIAGLDLAAALKAVSYAMFKLRLSGQSEVIPLWVALTSIFGHATLAIALVAWRVRSAQRTGVGSSS
jgi:hypothetical protein